MAGFVRGYEEPTLELAYGEEYREYRRNVRGWIPRVRPWNAAAARGFPPPDRLDDPG